jgi:hypothetical protein
MSRFINTFRPFYDAVDAAGAPCSFWCQECDSKVVIANDTKTGLFFAMTGHKLLSNGKCRDQEDPKTPEHMHVGDPYLTIVMALCPDCMVTTGFIDLVPDGQDEMSKIMGEVDMRLPEYPKRQMEESNG